MTQLCLQRGADVYREAAAAPRKATGFSPLDLADRRGHAALTAYLGRVHDAGGWARYRAEMRYELLGLRALAVAGRARRVASGHDERFLDFLFPGESSRGPRLPTAVFPRVLRYLQPEWFGPDDFDAPPPKRKKLELHAQYADKRPYHYTDIDEYPDYPDQMISDDDSCGYY